MTSENAGFEADFLYTTAKLLAQSIDLIKRHERQYITAVLDEPDLSEKIQTDGEEICRALRIIAQRLDRAVVSRG